MLKISLTKWLDRLTIYFYWIIMIGYTLAVFFPAVSIVVLSSVLLMAMFVINVTRDGFVIKKDLIYIYMIYIVFSFWMYFFNGIENSLYFVGLAYSLLPMVMFIIPKNKELYMRKTFEAILFSLIVGMAFYIWAPNFYGEYLVQHNYLRYSYQIKTSFQGLYGITTIGTYSACCIIYYYGQWLKTNNNRELVAMFFSAAILIFTMRRSAVVACVLIFVVENIVFWNKSEVNRKKQLLIMVVLVIALMLLVLFPNEYLSSLYKRVIDVSSAVSERSGNWGKNIESMKQHLLFGTGIGSGGHMASAAGHLGVHDNSYLLILKELGIIGLGIFIIVFLKASFKYLVSNNKTIETHLGFFIACIFIIQAIGSNVWEFPLLGALFWGCLSCCTEN